MRRKVWLEVALNGPWGRRKQPGIPITADELVAEGVACVRAGAAVVHVHAYDPATDEQDDDPETYAAVIRGIQREVDAIVYPTVPMLGGAGGRASATAADRFRTVEHLAAQGLLEWSTLDPGSVNFALYEDLQAGGDGFIYQNPSAHVRHGLALGAQYGFRPAYACYEPGFTRLGAALAGCYPSAPPPIYRLMFSDQLAFGFPPRLYALDAHVRLLNELVAQPDWMVAGLGVDIGPLIEPAVARGGHIRVGLEDAPLGTATTNIALVEHAASAVEATGARLATAAEIRAHDRGDEA